MTTAKMKRFILIKLHNLFAHLGWEKPTWWCYKKWMRWHMEKDPLVGYFTFSDDYFSNSYKRS